MIRNISYNSKELREEMISSVGKSFSMLKRIKLKGIGSQRYVLFEASKELEQLISRDNMTNFCNIELRKKGVVLRFRSKSETYGWMVPFHLLSIIKSEDYFAIFAGADFVRLKAAQNSPLNHKFIQKLLQLKLESNLHYIQIDQL
jgi:hypothetical protein